MSAVRPFLIGLAFAAAFAVCVLVIAPIIALVGVALYLLACAFIALEIVGLVVSGVRS